MQRRLLPAATVQINGSLAVHLLLSPALNTDAPASSPTLALCYFDNICSAEELNYSLLRAGLTTIKFGFDSLGRLKTFLFYRASRRSLKTTEFHIQRVTTALPVGKRDERVKLATQIGLVPSLRMQGAVPALLYTPS
jgi:hypothetical protein